MKRTLAAITVSLSLVSCVAPPPPDEPVLAAETPLPGDAVKDAKAAVEITKKECHVAWTDIWLTRFRWSVALHGGVWHVRLPSHTEGLRCPVYDVGIRAVDGGAITSNGSAFGACVPSCNIWNLIVGGAQ